jgi:hypothetical protein
MFCYNPLEETLGPNGIMLGNVWVSGAIVYGAVVIIANLRLLNSFNNYTFWGELFVTISISSYFLLFWAESVSKDFDELTGVF